MGSEAWFLKVVGLQNWSIDPRKDMNHINKKDLQMLFEDRIVVQTIVSSSYHTKGQISM